MEIKANKTHIIGAFVSVTIMLLCILIFVFRMCGYQETEYWIGVVLLLTAFPLYYLFRKGKQNNEPRIYFIQILTLLTFLIVELLFDYILNYPFREIKWMLIIYVMLFFAGTGGMIGIASKAGKIWSILTILLFINMAALAFMQHFQTGS